MAAAGKARFEGTVQPWGNSLGIRITRTMSDMAHLARGDKVAIEVTDEGLLIRRVEPVRKPLRFPFSEAELVSGLTPHTAHADELPDLLDSEIGG